jgi:hypothetical protein
MTPPAPSTIELEWLVHTVRIAHLAVPIARLRSEICIEAATPAQARIRKRCWLDTGAPISVIPFYIQSQGLVWKPLPGLQTTWAGQPCAMGHMNVWLPTGAATLRGPISMLAQFPQSDPPGDPVPILIGLEFLLAHHASLTLWPPPQRGAISVP